MQLDIYESYAEANEALELPHGTGACNDLTPIPALDQKIHPEQYTAVVYVRKWTYDGNKEPPDLHFLGLECVEHLHDGYKFDLFIYARTDGNDTHN